MKNTCEMLEAVVQKENLLHSVVDQVVGVGSLVVQEKWEALDGTSLHSRSGIILQFKKKKVSIIGNIIHHRKKTTEGRL